MPAILVLGFHDYGGLMLKINNDLCIHCILQTDTKFDPGFLCKLKPVNSKYGPYYERINTEDCYKCSNYIV